MFSLFIFQNFNLLTYIYRKLIQMKKLKWGILSTSGFSRRKMIPALLHCRHASVYAVASRDISRGREFAAEFNIPVVYGDYMDLLNDKEIDVIYNPLPNHLHKEWTIKAMEHGKHVLCEKPLALSLSDVREMIEVRDRYNVKAGEAFMVKTHPQWLRVKEIVVSGRLGQLQMIHGFFSYFKDDPDNIRNIAEYGGGSLWDIGCYCTMLSRFILNAEPTRVMALIDFDKKFKTDRLVSAILDFKDVQVSFTSATQLVPYQRMQFFGTKKMLEVQIPFNSPPDSPSVLIIDDGDLLSANHEKVIIDPCNQYTIEGNAFSLAILENKDVPSSFEDAYKNIAVLKALFRSAETNSWETVN